MLVDEVVQLVVHTIDHMVTNIILLTYALLQMSLFHVVVEIPGYYNNYILIMISGHNLQPVLIHCLDNFDNFNFRPKLDFDVLQNVPIDFLQDNVHFLDDLLFVF